MSHKKGHQSEDKNVCEWQIKQNISAYGAKQGSGQADSDKTPHIPKHQNHQRAHRNGFKNCAADTGHIHCQEHQKY
jgi:hypothetical protein